LKKTGKDTDQGAAVQADQSSGRPGLLPETGSGVNIAPMDAKTKEAKLIRAELLKLQRHFMLVTDGLLSRLDVIDPPAIRPKGKPKTREQAKAFLKSL